MSLDSSLRKNKIPIKYISFDNNITTYCRNAKGEMTRKDNSKLFNAGDS